MMSRLPVAAASRGPQQHSSGGSGRSLQAPSSSGSKSLQVQQRAPNRDVSDNDAAVLKSMVSSQFQYQVRKNKRDAQPKNPVSDFVQKLNVAWRIFFPEQPEVSAAGAGVLLCVRLDVWVHVHTGSRLPGLALPVSQSHMLTMKTRRLHADMHMLSARTYVFLHVCGQLCLCTRSMSTHQGILSWERL